MNESELFGAPWDQKLTVLTIVISAVMLGATVFILWLAYARASSMTLRAMLGASAVVTLGVFVIGAAMAPRGYAIRDGILRIERRVAAIEIPLASIRAVERLPEASLAGSVRTLGSGGFFGYYGRFRNGTLGDYRMYATRCGGYVLVRADRPYVLTPDSPDRFIDALNRGRGPAAAGGGAR